MLRDESTRALFLTGRLRRLFGNSRGMALMLTILIISLIIALTVQFNRAVRSDLHAAVNLRDGIRYGCIAKSGFDYALAVLLEDSLETNFDSLLEAWADSELLSENTANLFSEGRFDLKVTDLAGRIQINKLVDEQGNYDEKQKGLLTRFLKSERFGLEQDQVDDVVNALKDWIDKDDDSTGLGGAESGYYQGLDEPYSCRNAPVESLEELQYVRYFKQYGLFEKLSYRTQDDIRASYLSPHGDGKININTADPMDRENPGNTADSLVLKAVSADIDDDMVASMREYREAPENDLSKLKWDERVGAGDVPVDKELLTTSSTHFEIVARGQKPVTVKDEDVFKTEWVTVKQVTGIVKRKDGGFDILSLKVE